MVRVVVYFLLAVGLAVSAFFIKGPVQFNLAVGASAGLAIPLIEAVVGNLNAIRFIYYSLRFYATDVRISTSYLFRIKVDGKYLLIRGRRYADQFQPVGGVHKISPSGSHFLAGIGALDDDLIPVDQFSANDMRIVIKGRHLLAFYNWFHSRGGREDSPWREFHEELISSGILAAADFPFIMQDFEGIRFDPIRISPLAGCREILIADIYELLPSLVQVDAMRRLMHSGNIETVWVTAQDIAQGRIPVGAPAGTHIAPHARKIL